MMVTIRGLPVKTKYQDVKVILKNECNITEFILDNLVNDESGMSRKVRVGLVEDSDGYEIIKCLNGLRMPGNYVLRVDIVGKPPPAGQQDQGRYEPKPASSFTNEYRNNYPNQHTNDFRGRPNAPGFESSYTAQESQFSGPTASHGPSGGHGSISSHGPMNSAGRPAPWSSSNSLNNQWNQTQSGSSQISYQQPGNPGYAQQYPSNSQRPNTGPYTHGRPEHGQRYGYSAKTNPHEMGGSRKPDNRTHVLRNVELVDTQPTNSPIQSGRYPPGQGFQQQPKPITIMKDNFQGPTTYDIGSSNPPSSYQRQRQGSPQPWATQGQQLKPQPYPKSNTGPYEKPYDQIRSSRPDLQKNAQPPMRTDVYKGFEKSGQRFSPHRPIASGGRPLSPSRPVGPVRAVSPSNTLAQGRRMSPSRRLMSPTRRLTSPADRMMSTLDRRPGGPPRDLSQRHQLSPHERPGRGNVPRFSPQRHHPNKPIDKNIDPALKSANHNRAAYDVTSQAPNQPVYSGGFRPNVHENVPFPRSTRQIEQNVPWQQDGEQMYAKMKKRDEDGLGTPRPNTYGDKHSPRKSRSPIRRDRSPIRDRYRRHSPSSPSPRRSWAFEKRRSPQVRDAPPPPNWPGQNIQDDGRFKPVSDIKEDNSKHGPVWDKHTFTKLDDSKRRNEKLEPYSGPSKVFRTDAHESHDELITKRQRDPIFGARNEFENRGDFRPTTNDEPKPYLNKQDIEYHYSAELENTRRLSEARRKESPRRGEAKSNEFKKFDKDIDIIYKRAQEFKKKADELRKSERRMKERSEERGRTTRIMEEKEFKVQSEASTRRIDDTFRRHDSPRRRMNESPRHRMDNSPRQRLDSSPRRRRDGSPRHRIDGSPRRRMEGSPRRRMEASPRRRMEGSPRRRMEGSPRRRMEDSPRRRMEDSPRRRMEGSPRRRMEGSPRRRMEGSPTRPMEDLPRRRMEDSPRRRMEGSPRRRMQGIDDSLQHRINDSPPRRIDDTPNYSRSDTENRRHGDLNTKVSPSREPVWKAVDKTRKLFAGLPLQVKIKRDKAAEEISKKIMSKKLVVAKLSSEARDRVLEELRKTISHKLTELFDVQDLAFIELVIKFQSRVSDQEKDKIFNDVVKSLPARIRNRKALGSDSPNVPHKKPKLSMDYKLIEESPNVPSRKRSPERKLMEKSSDVPSKKAKRSPENKTKEEATATQRTQGGIYIPDWKLNVEPSNMQISTMQLMSTQLAVPNIGSSGPIAIQQLAPPQLVIPTLSSSTQWMMVTSQFDNNATVPMDNVSLMQRTEVIYDLFLCKDDFAFITATQAELLKNFVVSEIVKVTEFSQGWAPDFTFKGLQSMHRYVLSTKDEASMNWLINLDFSEFIFFNVLVYTKEELWYERAAIWLPGHSKHRNGEPLDKLKLQNKKLEGVNVGKWKMVKKIVTLNGIRLYVDMPPSSARALEKHNMLLSYELQKVSVFLKAVAVDKDAFDVGLKRKSITDESALADVIANTAMPSIQNCPTVLKIALSGCKYMNLEQARKIKENIIYHIYKYHSADGISKTDFVKYGFISPHYFGVIPENTESKRWLMNRYLGKLNRRSIIVISGDEDSAKFFRMTVIVPNEPNVTALTILEKLKQSNQGVKGINFQLWKPIKLKLCSDKTKVQIYLDVDLQSVKTIIEMNYELDYMNTPNRNITVFVNSESSNEKLLESIKEIKKQSSDNYDVANMDLDSGSDDDDVVCLD